MPTRTSSTGSAASETRIVSPMPSASRVPNPIADLIVPIARRAGLGDAQMKSVVHFVGEHAIGFDHHQRIGGFERNLDFLIADVFEDTNMAQAAFDHALGGRSVVFLQQIFFQRAGVDADADRNFTLGGGFAPLLRRTCARRCCRD